jgi:L-rhamnose mutarotase
MRKIALVMKLKPGCEAEYKRRHDELWPEMADMLRKAGVSDYSIFLDRETLSLFAVHRLEDENTLADLPNTETVKKWWAHMADIMETNPDNSPRNRPLEEVFYLE